MYRRLFSFTLPVELCPNCGATQSFGEKSPSHNIHFLRVTKGGRIAWGSVGTWHAFSMPNAYAASAVAWELD